MKQNPHSIAMNIDPLDTRAGCEVEADQVDVPKADLIDVLDDDVLDDMLDDMLDEVEVDAAVEVEIEVVNVEDAAEAAEEVTAAGAGR